ncbi:hypothetical protein JQC91_14485 [Jannaschia sp. Os4]|uniref:hypothetical protein n=1 Tax=Jannaschia sp. Os4 TaxID=2807617 RepID=UPI00193976EF|nr:hypothetical protein [Jannaschia sp. Os4]MBM2577512.1 hypothetical protein [Jannaschia sp. Os4]
MKFTLAALALLVAGAAHACPDWSFNGQQASFSGKDLWAAKRFPILAGGDQEVSRCKLPFGSDRGRGYVPVRPDFTITLSGLRPYRLVASVYSECDSVLVMNTGAESWFYDDDDNADSRLDARIVLTRPQDGIFDFWVGTHDGSTCNAVFELETFDR